MARRFPFRKFRTAAERRDYEHERDAKYNWVFPKVDAKRADFTGVEDFAASLFPHSQVRQQAFCAIVKVLAKRRKPLYLRDVAIEVHKAIKVSNTTLNDVWKSIKRSGLIFKKNRQDPCQPSLIFSSQLRGAADYWENYATSVLRANQRKRSAKPATEAKGE